MRLIVEVIEPYHGRIFDAACGSGGMFVHSAHFVERHQRSPGDELSIYGQEKTGETVRLARMNLAIHGLSGDVREGNSYYDDLHRSVGVFDFVMANPPFNVDRIDKAARNGCRRSFCRPAVLGTYRAEHSPDHRVKGTPVPEVENHLYDTIDRQNAHLPAVTRRRLVQTTAAALGSMGLLGVASNDAFATVKTSAANSVENLTAVAATAEVLATIVNTVGPEKLGSKLDPVTLRNVRAAAQQEKNHYELLTSSAVGGKAVTKTIYVPDEVFASQESLLTTLVVGDQVFINAYLLATTVFARQGTLSGSKFARYTAEIMATEAVHRALALQSLGRLGNDRVYAKFAQNEETTGLPTTGKGGFFEILNAVTILESAGFGFGKQGSKPGTAYDYDTVAARTPTDPNVNTLTIR